MQKSINLCGRSLDYTLKTSRRSRRLRLAVHGDGQFVVTAPVSLRQAVIDQFIQDKAEWVIEKIEKAQKFSGYRLSKGTKAEFAQHKEAALKLVTAQLETFNQLYGFTYRKVSIKNQKTRWGSCSKKGNLNFSYRVALLPEHLRDYVIVHELCHLGEFNHSKNFWALVAWSIPDYRERRRELRLG